MNLSELRVYNLANEIGDEIWGIVELWDPFKKGTLGKQLVRSADSISAKIAEGYGRHYKENKNFLYYSRGSAYETLDHLIKAKRRKIIPDQVSQNLQERI